jgi:hypothetical protein
MNIQLTITDQITKDLKDKARVLKEIKQPALEEFRRLTPRRTGKARSNTLLQGTTIKANYPYAQRLEEGYSKQAPQGISKPWTKWMDAEVNKRLGKA